MRDRNEVPFPVPGCSLTFVKSGQQQTPFPHSLPVCLRSRPICRQENQDRSRTVTKITAARDTRHRHSPVAPGLRMRALNGGDPKNVSRLPRRPGAATRAGFFCHI